MVLPPPGLHAEKKMESLLLLEEHFSQDRNMRLSCGVTVILASIL